MRHVKKYCLRKRVQVNDYSKEVNVTTIYVILGKGGKGCFDNKYAN